MKVLVYGSGGRDHCLADTYADSQHVDKVYFTPGNPGVNFTSKGKRGLIELVKLADFTQVADFCELRVRTDPAAPKHKGISWLIMLKATSRTPSETKIHVTIPPVIISAHTPRTLDLKFMISVLTLVVLVVCFFRLARWAMPTRMRAAEV